MHGHNQTTSHRARWAFLAFLAAGAFYLVLEHRAHLGGALRWLPLGVLLLCPLMHLMMHGGHGTAGHVTRAGDAPSPGTAPTSPDPDESKSIAPRGHGEH